MPAIGRAVKNAFSIAWSGGAPAFSGVNGQIDHALVTGSGKAVTERGALRVAAIWIATTVLADEVSSLAVKIVKKDDKDRAPLQPKRLRPLWGDPNPDQTRMGLEATEVLSMALWGAHYTFLGWTNAGALDVRWPLDPANVSFHRLDDMGLRLKVQGMGELENRPGERPQFMYTPMYTLPGQIEPVSPVRMAAELAGLSLAYQETAAKFMGRGLNPSAILTSSVELDDPEAARLSARLGRAHGGSSKSGGIAVIGGKDLKLERMTMSMADAEFVEQNEQVFKILLAMWRVPPTVAGMVDKPSTWGTGIAEFSRGLERFTLRPIVQRRQAAFEKYITKWEDPELQVRYKFDSLLSSSPKERTGIQSMRLRDGMTSVERVLAQEDEPPFDEDETTFSQLAYASEEDRESRRTKQRAEALAAQALAAKRLKEAGFDDDKALEMAGLDGE